jgi:O-antigen/teichoic acid export membrane protein
VTRAYLFNAALRLSAMGGKFVFLLFAASAMRPDAFGRIGIVLATTVIVIGVTGLEAYQTLLRQIAQGEDQPATRAFYLRFAMLAGLASTMVAAALFKLYGWPLYLVALAALVVGFEHLNIEACRTLVVEGRPMLSILAMSARTGLWAIALPLLSLLKVIPGQWSEFLVLSVWLACSIAGLLCWIPIASDYLRPRIDLPSFKITLVKLLRLSVVWIVVVVSWRCMENGGRLITAYLFNDELSGRFTLLATIASFGLVGVKGILEPMFFARMLQPDGDAEIRRFRKATAILVVVTAMGSVVMAVLYNLVASKNPITSQEWAALLVLIVAFDIMTISQVWHFRLYRSGRDRHILWSSIAGGVAAVLLGFVLTRPFGLQGAAFSILVGAVILAACKWRSSCQIKLT